MVVVIVGATFAVNLFVNPPYGFSIEDNLASVITFASIKSARDFWKPFIRMAPSPDSLAGQ